MDYLHAIMLALVQGLSEFLPISSSAHLILLPRLLGWADQGLAFDVAVHVGTLAAVIAYFRHDVACLLCACAGHVQPGRALRPARQHERLERLERLVVLVDPDFEPLRVRGLDAQALPRFPGHAEIRATIE